MDKNDIAIDGRLDGTAKAVGAGFVGLQGVEIGIDEDIPDAVRGVLPEGDGITRRFLGKDGILNYGVDVDAFAVQIGVYRKGDELFGKPEISFFVELLGDAFPFLGHHFALILIPDFQKGLGRILKENFGNSFVGNALRNLFDVIGLVRLDVIDDVCSFMFDDDFLMDFGIKITVVKQVQLDLFHGPIYRHGIQNHRCFADVIFYPAIDLMLFFGVEQNISAQVKPVNVE
jgi:hypothetical protein